MKYGVIVQNSYYTEGDERFRTNPGHGYPDGTTYDNELIEFPHEEAFKLWVKSNSSGYFSKKFRAVRFEEVTVSTEIVVNVG